jgi:hypothetical protein
LESGEFDVDFVFNSGAEGVEDAAGLRSWFIEKKTMLLDGS